MTSDIKQARTHLGEVYGSEDSEKYLTRCASVATAHALLAIHDLLDERLPARQRIVTLGLGNLDAFKHELETPMREHGECCEPGERAPREDEDEALARAIYAAEGEDDDGEWDDLQESVQDDFRRMARAAREHLNPDGIDWESTLSSVVQDRDAAIDRAEAERDALRERLDALRADVEACRNACQIEDILDRDDERAAAIEAGESDAEC